MNSKQMKKWLEQQGATFAQGRGSHLKVFLHGKHSALPMHGTKELGKGASVVRRQYLHIKPRLRAQGGVANPRDTPGYRCGLRLALSTNASVLFVQLLAAHHTGSHHQTPAWLEVRSH